MSRSSAQAPPAERAEPRVLGQALAFLPSRFAEPALYLLLMGLALMLRVWDLGSRALHHDESLHAVYSWYLYQGRGYIHDPMMHGPFKFHATALLYFLFGDSDVTARLAPALFGTALVGLPFFLRPWLGRTGAFAAALLLTISPVLLYFSRFARDDIFVAVWTTGLVVALWRFLVSGNQRLLLLAATLLALSFATKEDTYIIGAIFGSFFALWLVASLLVDIVRNRWGGLSSIVRREPMPGRLMGVVMLLATLVLPLAGPLVALPVRRVMPDWNAPMTLLGISVPQGSVVAAAIVLALFLLGAALGTAWNARLWWQAAALYYGAYAVLFTSFFTNVAGFATGIWGSLDYWLTQQGVERGGQPWYYYLVLLPIYEFLPLFLALLAAGYFLVLRVLWGDRRRLALLGGGILLLGLPWLFQGQGPLAVGLGLVVAIWVILLAGFVVLRPDPFLSFLFAWVALSFVAYAIAGEKMPWISVHMALPIIFLAAFFLDRAFRGRLPWHDFTPKDWAVTVLAVVALLGLGNLVSRFAEAPSSPYLPAMALLWVGVMGLLIWWGRDLGRTKGLAAAMVAVLAILGFLTLRAGFQASYKNGDVPVEMLVYTQTSPDIPRLLRRIEEVAQRTNQGKELPITVDASQGFTWPWAWYLRYYKRVDYPDLTSPSGPPQGTVLLLNAVNEAALRPFVDRYALGERFRHRWWFPEEYRGLTWGQLGQDLTDPARWSAKWRYFLYRQTPSPLGSSDGIAYFPKELGLRPVPALEQPPPTDPYAEKRKLLPSELAFGALGSALGFFSGPKGLALDAQGNLYVADSGNHRIQKFDSQGRLVAQVGRRGSGSGEFNEPWGVAVDGNGNLYVADTWNHRIQKFDASLRFVTAWGGPLTDNQGRREGNEGLFYGPRAIAVDKQGFLYVADTGNKRIQKFDGQGRFLASYGGQGSGPGQFLEPVGIVSDVAGNYYVADTWNRRIQVFDPAFRFLRQVPVPGWQGQGILNKPYLTVTPQGEIWATDPENHRLLRFDAAGSLRTILGRQGMDNTSFNLPIGIASDNSGRLFVAETGNHRIQRFAFAE